jgi:cobalt-zinc-cadmium efflux system protein
VLVSSFAVLEVVAGLLTGSLAVLADAGHMLTDTGSIGLALFASWLGSRPVTPQRSFGFRRAEILAALANGVALVAIAIWIFVEAGRRFSDPPDVRGGWVLAVGLAGLGVNAAAAWTLMRGTSGSLNTRAALLHVLADLAGSLAVIASALLVLLADWRLADPLLSVLIGVLVLGSSWHVLSESVAVLLESTPPGMSADQVGRAMAGFPQVVEVHDLHIWTITSGFPALSAHVLVEPDADCHAVRRDLEAMLARSFALDHTTLQVDHAGGTIDVPVEIGLTFRRTSPLGHRPPG